jgi:nitroreductase
VTRQPIAPLLLSAALLVPAVALAADPAKPVPLPKPRTEGGMPLLAALKQRASSREFRPDPLPAQLLSDLLWAAVGVNRPDGRRTAPSPLNRQALDVYVVKADGAFLFDPKAHALVPVAGGDLRKLTGGQPFVASAPVNLVYVLDGAKLKDMNAESLSLYGAAEAGFVSQNVYLFCASEGLATVVRGMVPREALAPAIGLRPEQKIVLSQTVGFPPR